MGRRRAVVLAAAAVSVPVVSAGRLSVRFDGGFGDVFDFSAFDAEGFAVDEGVGDFFVSGVDDAAEGLTRRCACGRRRPADRVPRGRPDAPLRVRRR